MTATEMPRNYLDHAATSWPKSPAVVRALADYLVDVGASAARGSYRSAGVAGDLVARVRRRLAQQIGASSENDISFHAGCTLALNAAIAGLIPPPHWDAGARVVAGQDSREPGRGAGLVGLGDHVLASAAEHNAVLRPLHATLTRAGAELQIIPCDNRGRIDLHRFEQAIRPSTRLAAVTMASNVTGCLQPIGEIAEILERHNRVRRDEHRIRLLCDAAQVFGYLPIDVTADRIDLLAAPAHKGGGGPPGIGMLYVGRDLHDRLVPLIHGGTGRDGESWTMPDAMPAKLEPGTLNLPALAGWDVALREDASSDAAVHAHLRSLGEALHTGLRSVPGCRVYGQAGPLPIASFTLDEQLPPAEIAAILDSEFGIEVRAGYHCAAALHESLGTRQGGTVRVSAGRATEPDQIAALIEAMRDIAGCTPSLS